MNVSTGTSNELICNVVSRSMIPEVFRGTLSLLRFFKKYGQLYVLDKLANAIDAATVIEIIKDMLGVVSRLKPKDKYCIYDERVDERDVGWYKRLGADVDEQRNVINIECPYIPDKEELSKLALCIETGVIRPSDIVAFAYTYD